MHDTVMAYARAMLTGRLMDATVLEVGSYDVNGNLRELCEELGAAHYVGSDMRDGPGVDWVTPAEDLPRCEVDVVVSTEMLEHALDWKGALRGCVRALRDGGLLLLTCRGPGAGFHPHPGDHWRFTPLTIYRSLGILGMEVLDVQQDTGDHGVLSLSRKTGMPSDERLPAAAAAPPSPYPV